MDFHVISHFLPPLSLTFSAKIARVDRRCELTATCEMVTKTTDFWATKEM